MSSCSGGGGDETDSTRRFDYSPHALVPEGTAQTEVRVRGIHFSNTGWEMGTTPDDGPPPVDATENQFTLFCNGDGADSLCGTVLVRFPWSSMVDNPDDPHRTLEPVGDENWAVAHGTWWQERISKENNTVMYVHFQAEGYYDMDGDRLQVIYKGDDLRFLLRERTMDNGDYRWDGAVTNGKVYMYGSVMTSAQGAATKPTIKEVNFIAEPCTFILHGSNWEPDPGDD